jgi:hypothetical protein
VELRCGVEDVDEVHGDITLVVGELRREQTKLSLELIREN